MLNCCLTSNLFCGIKKVLCTNSSQNIRWVTSISTDFSESELSAAKPYEEIPSMRILPLVGTGWVHLPLIGRYDNRRMVDAILDKRKKLGDIYREKFGNLNMVFSFNPDDLQTMYQHEGPYPVRTDLEAAKAYRESRKQWFPTLGMILLDGKEWHDIRMKTQRHLLKPKAIQAYLKPMQDLARDFVQKILIVRDANREVPDFLGELYKWGLESIALVGLDTRLGCLDLTSDSDGVTMINSFHTALECMNKLEALNGNLPWWKYFPTPTWRKLVQAFDILTELSFKHINRSLEKLKNASEDQELTLLQSLLIEKGTDVPSAVVIVSDLLLAGIEPVSNTIGFFLYNMARNPQKQELLYEDLKRILPRKEDRITPALLNELRYLKACLKESQRLDPVVSFQIRKLDHDVIFSGYRVPAGTILGVVAQAIYRDEKYFSNPDKYLPERWFNKDEKFHPYAFLPFSFGVRSCIGRRLAELEMICLAAELIRNFRVEYHYENIGIYTRFVNTPDKPLRFNFIER